MVTVAEGHELAGRYVVGRRLGVGGSGSVWQAHDNVLDRTVAVKVVPDGVAAARLSREARATAGIGVPNVVGVYDVGQQDGVHFLVMEYVDGVDLATVLRHTGPLEPDVAALIGRDVARGVAAVHAAELVHRDVTPANVLVTVEGEVKLTDLGIAQRTDDEDTQRLTQVGTVVGTVDYLAPEQVDGSDVTSRSDVYAVGLLLHTACTGQVPFGDGSVSERVARRLAGGPDRLADDVGELADVVATAVQRDPAERYADGRALQEALAALTPEDERPLRRRLAERVGTAIEERPDTGPVPPTSRATADPDRDEDDDVTTVLGAGAADGAVTTVLTTTTEGTPAGVEVDTGPTPPPTPDDGDATTVVPVGTSDLPDSPGDGQDRRAIVGPLLLGALGVAAVIALLSVLLSGGDGGGEGDGGGGGGTSAVEIAAVEDFDPLGGGDEHPESIAAVADGDGSTSWDTEGYDSAALGGLKSGVGFLVDLGSATDVGAVELDMGLSGADVTVVVSEGQPGGDPTQEGTVLGTASDTSGTVRIEGEAVAGQWVAVWFTGLGDDGGRYRAEVAEVRVFAP